MVLSRRDMLVRLLGLPAALAACKRRPPPRVEWEGGFVGPSVSAGHRIRDRVGIDSTNIAPKTEKVLILGAGISGLSSAWALKQAGLSDFRVLELEDEPGGTSSSGRQGELRYPWGAHYLPAPHESNPQLVDFLREAGSVTNQKGPPNYLETHLCADPDERVFYRGFWYEGLYPRAGATTEDLSHYDKFYKRVHEYVGARDGQGRRAFTMPSAACSPDPEFAKLDNLSFKAWLDREGLTSERLRWYTDYACRDDYGSDLETTSAWAGLFYFAARIPKSGHESSEFLTWPEGNGHFVDYFVKSIGRQKLSTGQVVQKVLPRGQKVEVRCWDKGKNRPAIWIADRVIFALPSFLRKYLIGYPDVPPYHPNTSPWLVANVRLADSPASRGYPQAWDNVIYGSKSLGYVVSTHQAQTSVGVGGPTVWTYYLPLTGDPKKARRDLLALDYQQACDAVVSELSRCHVGLTPLIKRIDIMRWGHAMVRPEVGHMRSASRLAAARPVGPVHFAHTDLSGIALFEEAFHHGTRAAAEVLGSLQG